jgi:hypothetical protein
VPREAQPLLFVLCRFCETESKQTLKFRTKWEGREGMAREELTNRRSCREEPLSSRGAKGSRGRAHPAFARVEGLGHLEGRGVARLFYRDEGFRI